ncbi:MAG: hypothetical protein GY948_08015 [Alphaproteobacteria bacterium]|nr:hypothetical protein [Alphaproteobacteria bacterium]
MKLVAFIVATFAAAVLSSDAIAGAIAYNCEIKATYKLRDDGRLELTGFHKQFLGGRFSVSRKTGEVIGDTLTTALAQSTEVIHFGDKGWSFKTSARFDKQIQVLEVQEFNEGDTKPFAAFSMGGAGIVTGICK